MSTASLFTAVSGAPVFSGADYDPSRDEARLTKQIDCIVAGTADQAWRTIQKLTAELRKAHPSVGFPENSVQAQLRNLRKIGYTVERRHIACGLFEYRVLPPARISAGLPSAEDLDRVAEERSLREATGHA